MIPDWKVLCLCSQLISLWRLGEPWGTEQPCSGPCQPGLARGISALLRWSCSEGFMESSLYQVLVKSGPFQSLQWPSSVGRQCYYWDMLFFEIQYLLMPWLTSHLVHGAALCSVVLGTWFAFQRPLLMDSPLCSKVQTSCQCTFSMWMFISLVWCVKFVRLTTS